MNVIGKIIVTIVAFIAAALICHDIRQDFDDGNSVIKEYVENIVVILFIGLLVYIMWRCS